MSGPTTAFVGNSAIFRRLQELVSDAIGVDLRGDSSDVCDFLNDWEPQDLRTDTPLMLTVESLLPQLLHQFNVPIEGIGSLQFPANIRLLQSERSLNTRNPYRTDYIHCDSWSGAPLDSFNLFLYLFVTPGSPHLAIYEFQEDSQSFQNRYKSYSEVPVQEKDLQPFSFATLSGNGALWPTATPHRTVLPDSTLSPAWRVSLDVRFRLGTPYTSDPNLPLEEFAESRMGSPGVYWDSSTVGCESIDEKLKRELQVAHTFGPWATRARENYLKAWYPEVGRK